MELPESWSESCLRFKVDMAFARPLVVAAVTTDHQPCGGVGQVSVGHNRPPGCRPCIQCKTRWDLDLPRHSCVHALRCDWQERVLMTCTAKHNTQCEGCNLERNETLVARTDQTQSPYCYDCWIKWWDECYPIEDDAIAMRRYQAQEEQFRLARLA